MSSILEIVHLISCTPGALVYHLVSLLAIEAGLGIVLAEWRRNRTRTDQRTVMAFGGLLGLKDLLLVVVLAARQALFLTSSVLSSLEHAADLAALLLLGWAFLSCPAPGFPDDKDKRPPTTSWIFPLGILTSFLLPCGAYFCMVLDFDPVLSLRQNVAGDGMARVVALDSVWR